ncbi:DUF4276 family protein [Desulfobulbus sp. F5]|nr:DUF4276 family protein [Desulfobulbus sp. F5]
MSKVEVCIIVEGPTEQIFVRDFLAPAMSEKGIYLHSARIGSPGHKGGNIRFERAKNDIGNFLKQRPDIYVSTMFDYFRIDSNWPGKEQISGQVKSGVRLAATQKAELLETATRHKIVMSFGGNNADRRFIPYIAMHEFEALLFSDPVVLAEKIKVEPKSVQQILAKCGSPEEINDRPETAPSKRIAALTSGYKKIVMGSSIAEAISIATMRRQCPHFNQWLTNLEQLHKEI